jgi:hypothetical protein
MKTEITVFWNTRTLEDMIELRSVLPEHPNIDTHRNEELKISQS